MRRFLTVFVRWMGALVALAITGWGALALAVVGPGGDTGRLLLAAMYGAAGLAAVVALASLLIRVERSGPGGTTSVSPDPVLPETVLPE